MIIQTKYNVGDEVYFFNGSEVLQGEITSINIDIGTSIDATYGVISNSIPFAKDEDEIFQSTKEIYKYIETQIKTLLKASKTKEVSKI